jgi:hypothetical protein
VIPRPPEGGFVEVEPVLTLRLSGLKIGELPSAATIRPPRLCGRRAISKLSPDRFRSLRRSGRQSHRHFRHRSAGCRWRPSSILAGPVVTRYTGRVIPTGVILSGFDRPRHMTLYSVGAVAPVIADWRPNAHCNHICTPQASIGLSPQSTRGRCTPRDVRSVRH